MREAQNLHDLNHKTSLKLLQKLLLHNIIRLEEIIMPNSITLMNQDDFKMYHSNHTKSNKSALNIAIQLFCQPSRHQICQIPC